MSMPYQGPFASSGEKFQRKNLSATESPAVSVDPSYGIPKLLWRKTKFAWNDKRKTLNPTKIRIIVK